MAQKNRANMLTDIVTNIFNNIINYITGQNAQDRFVNLLDSTPNILSDANQASGYPATDINNEIVSEYYNEFISRADMISKLTANEAVGFKFYQINDAATGTRIIQVIADSNITLYALGIDVQTGETGDYDINTDVFTPIVVSGTPTLSQVLTAGNTSGANDIEFDATQGLLLDNTSRLREGTIDAGLGGLKGIAQICGAGYELKWENGRLYVMGSSGNTIRQSLYNLTTTPTVTDDDTLGYSVGSLWTLDDGTVYVCSDATTGAAVWAIGGIPTLQQVTDVNNSTTNNILVDDGANNVVTIFSGGVTVKTGSGGEGNIRATNMTNAVDFELPNKPGGTETFAMLSDITGTVASVNSGTNISVDNTDPANPIINSLADRYSTSSISTNDIDNGNGKVFIVDANLAYIPLQEVLIVNAPSKHMHGTVVSYSGTTLTVDINSHTGTGTFSSWVINLDGTPVDAITGVGTVNEIAYFTAGQVIASLPVATYPSLTELARVKGVGSQVVGTTDTNTLTNKRITARTGTVASAATPTINTDNVDYYSITALAAAITSFTTNLSGAPTIGQTLWISIKDNGTARAIAWGASFEASTIALPTTTVISTRLDVAFIWNEATSVWRCVGVA
jgi:hypothetical protein